MGVATSATDVEIRLSFETKKQTLGHELYGPKGYLLCRAFEVLSNPVLRRTYDAKKERQGHRRSAQALAKRKAKRMKGISK